MHLVMIAGMAFFWLVLCTVTDIFDRTRLRVLFSMMAAILIIWGVLSFFLAQHGRVVSGFLAWLV